MPSMPMMVNPEEERKRRRVAALTQMAGQPATTTKVEFRPTGSNTVNAGAQPVQPIPATKVIPQPPKPQVQQTMVRPQQPVQYRPSIPLPMPSTAVAPVQQRMPVQMVQAVAPRPKKKRRGY